MKTLTPIGWAVSSKDTAQLRNRLSAAGIAVSEPVDGSRTTPPAPNCPGNPSFSMRALPEVPFFIVWSQQTAQPVDHSPSGCKLQQWSIASPRVKDARAAASSARSARRRCRGQDAVDAAFADVSEGRCYVLAVPRHLTAYGSTNKYRPLNRSKSGRSGEYVTQSGGVPRDRSDEVGNDGHGEGDGSQR